MFFDNEKFKFTTTLESNWLLIRQELEQLQRSYFMPWPEKFLYGKGWDVFGLYAFGRKLRDNCQLCPETTRVIETIPGMITAGFSSLAPGTHIKPHVGYSKSVLRCHLGLIVPDKCALRVGSQIKSWQEGKCFIFDDTTEHEAWNNSNQTRIALLIDFRKTQGLNDEQPICCSSEISKDVNSRTFLVELSCKCIH